MIRYMFNFKSEKEIKIMEGRVKDFEVLSTSTSDRQLMDETTAANRLYSLTKQCADVLENYSTKSSDIISSSLEMQPSALPSNDPYASANAPADEANTDIQQELISQIDQTKTHLTQLEQSRGACNANIEQLQNDSIRIHTLDLRLTHDAWSLDQSQRKKGASST